MSLLLLNCLLSTLNTHQRWYLSVLSLATLPPSILSNASASCSRQFVDCEEVPVAVVGD